MRTIGNRTTSNHSHSEYFFDNNIRGSNIHPILTLCYRDVQPTYFVKTNVYKHLVDYISVESELAIGPTCMGLVDISLLDSLKPDIVAAGALSQVLKLMVTCKSKAILAQCCKLCGSLALCRPNKALLANSGCMHALFDLILGNRRWYSSADDFTKKHKVFIKIYLRI